MKVSKEGGNIHQIYSGAQDIGIDVLEYDEGCFSFLVEGVDLFILLRSSLVIIFPLVGVFLEFDDLLAILRLGESTPPPDEEAMEGVADPARCLCPLLLANFEPSLILGDP